MASQTQSVSFASTAELLQYLSSRIIETLNTRDFNNPFLACLSPHLIGNNGTTRDHVGRQDVLDDYREMVQRYPNYRAEVQNVTCAVDENAGRAKVVMTTRIEGFAYDTVRQAAASFTWTREQGSWICAAYYLVRRIEEFE